MISFLHRLGGPPRSVCWARPETLESLDPPLLEPARSALGFGSEDPGYKELHPVAEAMLEILGGILAALAVFLL